MSSPNKIKLQSLLLMAALLAVFCGIITILDLLPHPRAVAETRRAALAHRTTTPANASQRHWRRAWTCPVGVSLTDAPAAWSNGWLATTGHGHILALDNSGRLLWNHTFSNVYFAGSPAVADATAIAAGCDGDVLAVDAATGGLLWRVKVDSACRHGPLAVRRGDTWQVVLLSSDDGVLRYLDWKGGRVLGQSEPTDETDGEPGCDGQYIAYGNCDAAMHVFSLTNSEQMTQIQVGPGAAVREGLTEMPAGVMAGGVLVRDGRIYGGTGGGELVCVDIAGSNTVWYAKVSDSEAFNTPVAVRDLVIMGARDGNIAAFAARNGAARWQVSLSNVVKTLCVVDDAVFTVAGGSLVGLRATDGRMFMNVAVGDDVDGPVWNGRVLVVAADGGNIIGFRGE